MKNKRRAYGTDLTNQATAKRFSTTNEYTDRYITDSKNPHLCEI
jgi:hypothetical protein